MLAFALLLAQGDPSVVPLSSLVAPNELRVDATAGRPRLIVGEPGKAVEARKPADLEGKVLIGTGEQALEYVRLLRAPGVWPLLLAKPILEVRHGAVLLPIPESLYKDLRIYTVSGWDGVVSEADWKRLGLDEPKVLGGNGKDWSVRRPCLLPEGSGFKVGVLVERVSEKGRYVWSTERLEQSPRGIAWHVTGARRG